LNRNALSRILDCLRRLPVMPRFQILLVSVLLVCALRGMALLDRPALYSYDLLNQVSATREVNERVVIIGLTEDDVRQFATLPLPDQVIADLIHAIDVAGPRAIGLTSSRDIAVPPGHEALKQAFRDTPYLIGIQHFPTDITERILPPKAVAYPHQAAISNVIIDKDGHFRRTLIRLDDPEHEESGYGLPWQLAKQYLQAEGIDLVVGKDGDIHIGDRVFENIEAGIGEYRGAAKYGTSLLLPYHRNVSYPTFSFHDLLEGRVPHELMADSVVVIGVTGQSLARSYPTPLTRQWHGRSEQTPSINILAHSVDDLISVAEGRWHPAWGLPEWANYLYIILCISLFFALSPWLRSTLRWFGAFFAFNGLMFLMAAMALRYGLWLPLVPIVIGTMLCGVGNLHRDLKRARRLRLQVGALQTIIDQLPEPVYVLDHKRRLQAANEAYCRIAGKLPEEMMHAALTVPATRPENGQRLRYCNELDESFEMIITERPAERGGHGARVGIIHCLLQLDGPTLSLGDCSRLEQRFEQAVYWTRVNDQQLFLLTIQAKQSGEGQAEKSLLCKAMRDRLQRALPDADMLFTDSERVQVHALLRRSREDGRPDPETLLNQFTWPLDIEDQSLRISITVGVSQHPHDGETLAALLNCSRAESVQ